MEIYVYTVYIYVHTQYKQYTNIYIYIYTHCILYMNKYQHTYYSLKTALCDFTRLNMRQYGRY